MSNRIRAFSTEQIIPDADGKLPDSIEWMPGGVSDICCSVDDKPAKVRMVVDESDTLIVQESLERSLAKATAGTASLPFIDFMHDGGAASAHPVEFFWDDGIRLRVKWTTAGEEAVSGHVFSYFSPEFFADKNGKLTGIPEIGPIGGLVNVPAFQSIERIAAALTTISMQAIAKALGLAETATEAEILAKIAELSGAATESATEAANLKAALELKVKEAADLVRASAVAEVERHAASSEIPEAVRPMIVEAIIKDATEGRKVLASFKPAKPAPGAAPFKAADAGKGQSGSSVLAEYRSKTGEERRKFYAANADAIHSARAAE